MLRRAFLSIAALLPTYPMLRILKACPEGPLPIDESSARDYRGYRIKWTGWKPHIASFQVAGQWIGYPLKDGKPTSDYKAQLPYVVSCVPGVTGCYRSGEEFNIALQAGQILITHETPDDVRVLERAKGLDRLLRLIDDLHAGAPIATMNPPHTFKLGDRIPKR